jgi:hypothetical protein
MLIEKSVRGEGDSTLSLQPHDHSLLVSSASPSFCVFDLPGSGMSSPLVNKTSYVEVSTIDTYLVPFEWEHVDLNGCRRWMGRHWDLSLYASAAYVILIFAGQAWMKDRGPFSLRRRLFFWNLTLAAFSIIGFLRTFPEILHVLKETGFYRSVCER